MRRTIGIAAMALMLFGAISTANAADGTTVTGVVLDGEGNPMRGVMITAIDEEIQRKDTVVTKEDGKFVLSGLPARDLELRARLIGKGDEYIDLSAGRDATFAVKFTMGPAEDMQMERKAIHRLGLIEWASKEDKENFHLSCGYCHQMGTEGFRTPEEPVDWEVMITRMSGFTQLHDDTQKTIVDKIFQQFGPGAEEKWPEFVPPEAPKGKALNYRVTEWSMGTEDEAMIHDLAVGKDGLMYVVNMTENRIETLDPVTAERKIYSVADATDAHSGDKGATGPHSIETAANGDVWITMATSGRMGVLDQETREMTLMKSNEGDRRGAYPHTLRIAQDGMVWYTDAGMNSVFSLNPENYEITRYNLKDPEDFVRSTPESDSFAQGESGGIVPYGIDIAPDGKVWYSKLNGQRIGVIDPKTGDIKEWKPPVNGPRRLQVAPNGVVWIPGFASGNFCSFNPETEEWKVFDLPGDGNEVPYALSIHPTTGDVWITGTGSDSMYRFNPETEELTNYAMPTNVTYTREIEFDSDGNIWLCNSNYPPRHIEDHIGSLIRLEIFDDDGASPVS